MAKGKDPFETFKQATLSGPSLSDAIRVDAAPAAQQEVKTPEPSPAPAASAPAAAPAKAADEKAVRRSNSEQVSFFLEKDLKKKLNLLKAETEKQFQDLYTEAIVDLLTKYGKL